MQAVELSPVAETDRNQSPLDLFLIFAGANIVATTLQVGASLVPAFGLAEALGFIAFGSVAGAGLVAALAPIGPRLLVPSVIACRAALGWRGASLVALLLYVTNFAWIAVNNVIAASACARLAGGPSSERFWAFGLGLLAAAIVAGGPRAVGLADRVAVPALLVVGVWLTIACLRVPEAILTRPGAGGVPWPRGLDVVIGYQVSWILMFADYSRYTRSVAKGTAAVFLGLAVTSLWFIPLGFLSARAAQSNDPGTMLQAVGLGASGVVLLTLATLTTNFVNIYLSSLAWKSLAPGTSDAISVWSIGLIGAFLSLFKGWLDRYSDFMLLLGALLVPVGGILLAHFFLDRRTARSTDVADLYDPRGSTMRHAGFSIAGLAAWIAGAAVYFLAGSAGGTLPSLATAVLTYLLMQRVVGYARDGGT